MKIKNLLLIASLLSLGFLSSCDKEEATLAFPSTHPVSGGWTVTYKVETSPGVFEDIYHVGESELLVYGSSANDGRHIWIDDHGNFWNYKVNAPVNMNDLTFSVQKGESAAKTATGAAYDIKVNVTNGKVIKNGTRLNGQPTDSIYFQVAFEDDEEEFAPVYHVSGHRTF